jgi:hypothetical protein
MLEKPEALHPDFFNCDELADIEQKVLNLYDGNCRVPLGLYHYPLKVYEEDRKKRHQQFYQQFGVYYERLRTRLSEIFDLQLQWRPDTFHYPGFHVFTKNKNFTNWHLDRCHHSSGQMAKIYSIAIPIRCDCPTGLLWTTKKFKDSVIKQEMPSEFLQYEVGTMYGWSGNTWHSTPKFKFEPNTYRITMQCHVAVMTPFPNSFIYW